MGIYFYKIDGSNFATIIIEKNNYGRIYGKKKSWSIWVSNGKDFSTPMSQSSQSSSLLYNWNILLLNICHWYRKSILFFIIEKTKNPPNNYTFFMRVRGTSNPIRSKIIRFQYEDKNSSQRPIKIIQIRVGFGGKVTPDSIFKFDPTILLNN